MRSWPTLTLFAPGPATAASEEWLQEQLASAAAEGAFRGLRLEALAGGCRFILTFASAAHRDAEAARLQVALGRAGAPPLCLQASGAEADVDWVARVGAAVRAVPLGRRHAAVPGEAEPIPGRVPIRVPRARAFGTGEHPSTRLAAGLLESWVDPGAPALDLGAGTGVLAALAALEGATPVVALEIDPVAADAAARTGRWNRIRGYLVVCGTLDALQVEPKFRTVVANIGHDVLLAALPELGRRMQPGAVLILSGLLSDQVENLARTARRWGLAELQRVREGEWAALALTLRPGLRPRVRVPAGTVRGDSIALPADEAHHLVRVRRLATGDVVEVVDGIGGAWSGILDLAAEVGQVRDLVAERPLVEPPVAVTLVVGVLHESGRFEALVRHATELGVARVRPIWAQRCQGRRTGPGRLRRWRRVAAEAVKQCGRLQVPDVEPPRSVEAALGERSDRRLLVDACGRSVAGLLTSPAPADLELWIGPEGGFTADERERLLDAGAVPVRLGPRTLRTETAALAALALFLGGWGDLDAGARLP